MDVAAVVTACFVAAGWAWWLSWSRRWKAVFSEAVCIAWPAPMSRLAHPQLWSIEDWPRERIEQELTERTGLKFPQW